MGQRAIHSFAMTDTGVHRGSNEDAFLADDDLGLYLVADGMGGHAGGEVAARMAVESVREVLAEQPEQARGDLLATAIQRASEAIQTRAQQDADLYGMGTTLTAVAFARGRAYLAHVGDSRCYLLRGSEILQLSEDHTVVEEMVRAGLLSPEQVGTSPMRHLLSRSVGTAADVEVDRLSLSVRAGDVFVLCSDGLVTVVKEQEIRDVVLTNELAETPRILIDLANDRGGPDNITVVVLAVSEED